MATVQRARCSQATTAIALALRAWIAPPSDGAQYAQSLCISEGLGRDRTKVGPHKANTEAGFWQGCRTAHDMDRDDSDGYRTPATWSVKRAGRDGRRGSTPHPLPTPPFLSVILPFSRSLDIATKVNSYSAIARNDVYPVEPVNSFRGVMR